MNATLELMESKQGNLPREHRAVSVIQRGEVASVALEEDQRCRLISRGGFGWVTMEGDPLDYVLAPSEVLDFVGPGRLVIEAIKEDRLKYAVEIP